ncbi:hypothetical protein O0L34_g12068 [Tuta absoluta]|nr:hypothetical protein O0L34_g12068 [Tuta absoluta]
MEKKSEIIANFESLLKQQIATRSKSLYNDKSNQNNASNTSNQKHNPQSIISNLAKQMKAIQSSENLKSIKKPPPYMEKYKTSVFLPVNMLDAQNEPTHPPDPQKFDTQLISNTQLINIVEDAEALDVNVGMTQEFETTFFNEDDSDDKESPHPTQQETIFPILDISLKEPKPQPILSPQKLKLNLNYVNITKSSVAKESQMNTDTQFDNCTQILNQCIEIDDFHEFGKILDNSTQEQILLSPSNEHIDKEEKSNKDQDYIDAPLSPVFNVKNKKTVDETTCLVYDLERFESFEKIAMPVIEITQDKEQAKFLINSQIIDKELILQTHFEDIKRISPIIDICDNPLKVNKELITKSNNSGHDKEIDPKITLKGTKSLDKCFLEDEILFSSDEENEYQNQSFKDLPFTCALETSFYESVDVLDKTMYVGFQTASNKSIQIETESFCKAKSLLDNVEENFKNEATLTELISMCESNKDNAKEISPNKIIKSKEVISPEINEPIKVRDENIDHMKKANVDSENTVDISMQVDKFEPVISDGDGFITNLPQVAKHIGESAFEGFRTASNKAIHVPEKALDKAKQIMQDINHDDRIEFKQQVSKTSESNKSIPLVKHSEESNNKADQASVKTEEQNINDDIIDEFQEEIMHTDLEEVMKNIENNVYKNTLSSRKSQRHKSVESKIASKENTQVCDVDFQEYYHIDFTSQSVPKQVASDSPYTLDKDMNIPSENLTFRTASNKEITVSNEALAKTKQIFNDFDMNDNKDRGNLASDAAEMKILERYKNPSSSNAAEMKGPNTKRSQVKELNSEKDIKTKHINDSQLCNSNLVNDLETAIEAEPPFCGFDHNDDFFGLIEETLEKSQKIIQKLSRDDNDNEKKANVSKQQNKEPDSNADYLTCNLFQIGFKTASNKAVKISESALAKSKKIFQDIDDDKKFETNEDIFINTEIKFKGFHTASNKKIDVSDEALAKSKTIFQDLNEPADDLQKSITKVQCKGFKTASNKEVNVSEEALARSRKIFRDISDDDTAEINPFCNTNIENTSLFKGFQTASNKELKISAAALAKSRKLFEDISDDKLQLENEKETKIFQKNDCIFKGFQTATKKEVKISAAALAKSRKLSQDNNASSSKTNDTGPNTMQLGVNKSFKDFQTTGKDKEVEVSHEALAKSQIVFQDKNDEMKPVNTSYSLADSMTTSNFMGFQTASKKQVKISEEALAKSRRIFEDIDNQKTTDNLAQKHLNLTKSTAFKGFQTASNKNVEISEDALSKSRKIFQDVTEETTIEISPQNHQMSKASSAAIIGFKTASKKQVTVSEAALAKSKKIFEEINSERTAENLPDQKHTDVIKTTAFKGFQTASKKEVKVSEEALIKSRNIFQDIDNAELKANITEIGKINDRYMAFEGFQTASNKNVVVSEEAIAESRRLFQDIDVGPENNKMSVENEILTDTHSKLKRINSVTNTTIRKNFFAVNSDKNVKPLKHKVELELEQKCSENFEDIDTQILNNFEVSMQEVTPKKSKRSGSPILSCPKSKKRKVFQIPYSQKSPKRTPELKVSEFKPPTIQQPENIYNFNSTYKKTKCFNLIDLQRIEDATTCTETIDYIQEFDFENILQFEFTGARNDINNSTISIPDLKDLFLSSVNKKLVPEGWLNIQLQLIIWKLISYEIKFPKTMYLTCTAKNVIEQLKFRYDKELYNAERPALRKIFEKDDTSTKTLILCVVAIHPVQDISQPPELLLTDGWYTIKAVIDKMLNKHVGNGKITVGTKLVTHGAELVGSEQAVSPWEDTSPFRLKLFGNSTRRARWHARLGYHGNAAILSHLSNVSLDGGKVSKLRVFVGRVYPALYVDKFEDGSTVTRSERLEHIHQTKFDNERQALLEKIYEDVEKEVMEQASQDSDSLSVSGGKRKMDSGSQIAKKMKNSRDPAEFRSHLTSTQSALLEDHTSRERERLLQTIQNRVQEKIASLGVTLNRNVVTLSKVRVAGVTEKNGNIEVSKALLSIWRPNEAIMEVIKEGTWIEILNVVPTAMRYSELQLSAGRQSIFSQSKHKESDNVKPYIAALKRTCHELKDLVKKPGMTTEYNEIDTVGIIFEINPSVTLFDEKKHQFQNVYLTDLEKNMISVNFWGGLKKFGFENVLDTGQIVACTNLQKRAGNSRKNIPQYRVTEFSYFTKTPKSESARKIIEEMSKKLHKIDKKKFCEECVSMKTNYSNKQHTSDNVTPYRFPNFDMNSSKNIIFIDSPLNGNKKDENLNLSGLDFESTFKQDTQDLSPKTLLRKRQVKEKIAKLKRYGEPPPLSPIQIINRTKNAASAFKSPFSKSDVSSVAISVKNVPNQGESSPSVANCVKNLPNQEKHSPSVANCVKNLPNQEESKISDIEIQCSPVIALNRTYVKRSNPVKLNFSNNDSSLNEAMDNFAEDFDCSPPLSLD